MSKSKYLMYALIALIAEVIGYAGLFYYFDWKLPILILLVIFGNNLGRTIKQKNER